MGAGTDRRRTFDEVARHRLDTIQVASQADGGYFEAADPIYAGYGQATGGPSLQPNTVRPRIHDRMTSDPSCTDVTLERCRWDQTYDASSFRHLSVHREMMLACPLFDSQVRHD